MSAQNTRRRLIVSDVHLEMGTCRAGRYADRHGHDVIICGHTHVPARISFSGKRSGRTGEAELHLVD